MLRRLTVPLLSAALAAAAAASARALVMEAETAPLRTVGTPVQGGWNLHSQGELGWYVRFPETAEYLVVVRARGSPCKGVWPDMAVTIGGPPGQKVTVASAEFADYALRLRAPAGVQTVSVAFLNDALEGGEDRNLYVDRIDVRALPGGREPVAADADEWAALGEDREEAALAAADQAIERHRKADASVRVIAADGRTVADAAVTAELVRHDFLFGCNIYMFDRFRDREQNNVYKKRFSDLFNYATVGFYWRSYEPERGRPRYEDTDRIVAWAAEHGIRLKGHPLLWGHEAGVPRWSDGQPPPEVQKARVQEIVRRYAGKIEFWEVVNEPAHVRTIRIDEPYRWAREADPKAHLIVNDYHVLADGFPPFMKLLESAKAAGVPFDGIGIQAHEPRTMRFPLDQVQRILDQYAALGKAIHITEFTPTSGGQPITGSHRKGIWNEMAQAEYAERFYRVAFGHPAVVAITWWDLADQGAWLKGGGLLRNDLSPKPAYDALWRLIHRQWKTRAEGRTDGAGNFAFRGVCGTYRVEVRYGGQSRTAQFHLAAGQPNTWTVALD